MANKKVDSTKTKTVQKPKKTVKVEKVEKVIKEEKKREKEVVSMPVEKKSRFSSWIGTAKRKNILTAVLIMIALTVLLTWILPETSFQSELVKGERSQAGLFDIFDYIVQSLSIFAPTIVYVLVIGGFYGVLYKTGAYRTLLDKIVDTFKGKEIIFLITTILLISVLTSITGASIALLMVVPLIISIIILMGYDRLTAALTTVGSLAVGVIGNTLSSTYVASAYSLEAQNGMGVVNAILTTAAKDKLLVKIIVLIVGIAILAFNVIVRAQRNKALNNSIDEQIFVPSTINDDRKKRTWPLVLIIDLVIVIALLSLVSWTSVFNVKLFSDITKNIIEFKIFGFPIFGKILGSAFKAFENWTLSEIGAVIVMASAIIALIYKIKFNEYIHSFIEGAKRAIKPAGIIALIYVVLIIVSFNPIVLTIVKPLIKGPGLNVFTMSLTALVSSVFNVDLYYSAASVLPYTITVITKTALYPNIALIWQVIYGFTALVAPTSIILMATLSYLHVSFIDWFKATWKFIVELLLVLVAILTIIVVIL